MRGLRWRAIGPFVVGIVAFVYFSQLRGYPFRLALVMGAALMLLGWIGIRTWERLRDLGDR